MLPDLIAPGPETLPVLQVRTPGSGYDRAQRSPRMLSCLHASPIYMYPYKHLQIPLPIQIHINIRDIHVHIHTYMHTYIHTYIHTYMYIWPAIDRSTFLGVESAESAVYVDSSSIFISMQINHWNNCKFAMAHWNFHEKLQKHCTFTMIPILLRSQTAAVRTQ